MKLPKEINQSPDNVKFFVKELIKINQQLHAKNIKLERAINELMPDFLEVWNKLKTDFRKKLREKNGAN